MRARPWVVVDAAIALLIAGAGALAQNPRENPLSSYETAVSTLLQNGWEIKAITLSPNSPSPDKVLVLQKGGQAVWCELGE